MKNQKKILFTDLDGTLLDDEKNISPGNQAAIDEALALGHSIVISTGRPQPSALIQAERLGLCRKGCYVISYNGGQIYDLHRRQTIYSRTLPRSLAAPIFREALSRDIHIQTYDATHILATRETAALADYARFTQIPFRIVSDIDSALTGDPCKLLAIKYNAHPELTAFQRDVLQQYAGAVDSFFSNDSYLEIVPSGVSKGFAVRWMCEHLGLPPENSVAAGDAPNDISMLEAAHVGAVMCNAFPGVAEHGTYLTRADNNHDGVAEIIRTFLLD